ncbi:expressed protein [Phakopsora pachyrhizi]|uniref:Expressed protein n=1 Tax=Phakopsora pachyrhizi TaxID=170000 RepID=A0AAV0AV72_PHAPC|nr:expressed protein [Phakopsora pachyrhizi]
MKESGIKVYAYCLIWAIPIFIESLKASLIIEPEVYFFSNPARIENHYYLPMFNRDNREFLSQTLKLQNYHPCETINSKKVLNEVKSSSLSEKFYSWLKNLKPQEDLMSKYRRINYVEESDQINKFLRPSKDEELDIELNHLAKFSDEAKVLSEKLKENVSNEGYRYSDLIFHAFRHILNISQDNLSYEHFLGWIKLLAKAGGAVKNEDVRVEVLYALQSGMNNLMEQCMHLSEKSPWVKGFLHSLDTEISGLSETKIFENLEKVPGARELFFPTMGVTKRMESWESFKNYIKFDLKLHNHLVRFSEVETQIEGDHLMESIRQVASRHTKNSFESKTAAIVFLHYVSESPENILNKSEELSSKLRSKAKTELTELTKDFLTRQFAFQLFKKEDDLTQKYKLLD